MTPSIGSPNSKEDDVYAVVRTYSGIGAKDFFDRWKIRRPKSKPSCVPCRGYRSYTLVRSGEGGVAVTVCEDKAGAEESTRVAREWIRQNASGIEWPPTIEEGSVVVQIV